MIIKRFVKGQFLSLEKKFIFFKIFITKNLFQGPIKDIKKSIFEWYDER